MDTILEEKEQLITVHLCAASQIEETMGVVQREMTIQHSSTPSQTI